MIPKWPHDVQRIPGPQPLHPHQSVGVVTRWTGLGAVLAVLVLWGEVSPGRLLMAIAVVISLGLYGIVRAERVSDSDAWQKIHR